VAFSSLDGAGSIQSHSLQTHIGGTTFGVGLAVVAWSGLGGIGSVRRGYDDADLGRGGFFVLNLSERETGQNNCYDPVF
jgi:hypothetical protein